MEKDQNDSESMKKMKEYCVWAARKTNRDKKRRVGRSKKVKNQ